MTTMQLPEILMLVVLALLLPKDLKGYKNVQVQGFCDSSMAPECRQAFSKVFLQTTSRSSLSLNGTVMEASRDLMTGIRKLCNEHVQNSYSFLIAFGRTETIFSAAIVSYPLGIPLLYYDTSPYWTPSPWNTMIQLHQRPSATGEAMARLVRSFSFQWVNVICQDRYLGDGFLSAFSKRGSAIGINTILNFTASQNDDWRSLRSLLRNVKSSFKVIVLHCDQSLTRRVIELSVILHYFDLGYAWFLTGMSAELKRDSGDIFPFGVISLERHERDGYRPVIEGAINIIEQSLDSYGLIKTNWPENRTHCDDYPTGNPLRTSEIIRVLKSKYRRRHEEFPTSDAVNKKDGYFFKVFNLVLDPQKDKKQWRQVGSIDRKQLNLSIVQWPGSVESELHQSRRLYRIITKISKPFVIHKEVFTDSGECYSYTPCIEILTDNISQIIYSFKEFMSVRRPRSSTYCMFCCKGLTVDLLTKLSEDLKFDYILFFIKKKKNGTTDGEHWEETLKYVDNGVADMVAGPLSITVERMKYIAYTETYFYTGFSMVTTKKERETPIDAFLLPFSVLVWLCIIISASLTALATSLFEWNSPFGLNPQGRKREKNYTLGSAMTMVYSVLFGHIVRTKSPKSWPSKVLQNFWSGLSIFIIASYTANLAAYLAGQSDNTDLLGIFDKKLYNLRVATIERSAAQYFMSKINPTLNEKLKKFYVESTEEAIKKLRLNEIDVYIHDTYLLKYAIVKMDATCSLTFAGESFGEDGYAFGLKRGSAFLEPLSEKILGYKSSGYIEELMKKYFSRKGCKRVSQAGMQYGPEHTAGLFVMLLVTVILSVILMAGEHLFFRYVIPNLRAKPSSSKWKSSYMMFFSQRLHRIITSKELVSPQSTAREIANIVRKREFAKFFQKDEIRLMKILRQHPLVSKQHMCEVAANMLRKQQMQRYAENGEVDASIEMDEEQLNFTDLTQELSEIAEALTTIRPPEECRVMPKTVPGISFKEAALNEEDILINIIEKRESAKSGIENPGFLRMLTDDGTASLSDDDAGDPEKASNNSSTSSVFTIFNGRLGSRQNEVEAEAWNAADRNNRRVPDDAAVFRETGGRRPRDLLNVTPSEYYKRSLKMKDNRVKSTIRRHALQGLRPTIPTMLMDDCTIEALSKEDLLVMWKTSEIELQRKLEEAVSQKNQLSRILHKHAAQLQEDQQTFV